MEDFTVTETMIRGIRKIAGAAAVPVGVVLLLAIIRSVYDFAGDPGKKFNSWRGDGLRKRAGDAKDAIDQNNEAKALNGGGLMARLRRPGAKGRQRRALRNQAAQSNLEAAQATFGQTDDKASKYQQAIGQNKAISAAAAAANNTALVTAIANNPNLLKDRLGEDAKNHEGLDEALKVQQERAIADAIKDVELKSEIDPSNVKALGDAMVKAMKEGDSISARAYQNMLIKAGGPGTDQYRKSMSEIGAEDMQPNTASAGAVSAVKRNLLMNHGSVKDTAADLVKHASAKPDEDTGIPPTMGEVSGSAGTWAGMSTEDLVKQKTHSLQRAVAAGGVSFDQAKEIQGDQQLYRKLDKGGKALIDGIVSGTINVAHEEALVQNALHDMDKRS
jgi:hypothetical protein